MRGLSGMFEIAAVVAAVVCLLAGGLFTVVSVGFGR